VSNEDEKVIVFIDGKPVLMEIDDLAEKTIGATLDTTVLDKQILKLLLQKPMTITAISKRIGVKYNTIINRLNDARHKGRIRRLGLVSRELAKKIQIRGRSIFTVNHEKYDEIEEMTRGIELPDKNDALNKYLIHKKVEQERKNKNKMKYG